MLIEILSALALSFSKGRFDVLESDLDWGLQSPPFACCNFELFRSGRSHLGVTLFGNINSYVGFLFKDVLITDSDLYAETEYIVTKREIPFFVQRIPRVELDHRFGASRNCIHLTGCSALNDYSGISVPICPSAEQIKLVFRKQSLNFRRRVSEVFYCEFNRIRLPALSNVYCRQSGEIRAGLCNPDISRFFDCIARGNKCYVENNQTRASEDSDPQCPMGHSLLRKKICFTERENSVISVFGFGGGLAIFCTGLVVAFDRKTKPTIAIAANVIFCIGAAIFIASVILTS